MINLRLALERGLSNSQVKDLIALHVAMDMMVTHMNMRCKEEDIPKAARKGLRKYVRRIEYQMQDIWGWDRDKDRHTHWKRFDCLKPNETRTVTMRVTNENGTIESKPFEWTETSA